jgi:hypothetical protein
MQKKKLFTVCDNACGALVEANFVVQHKTLLGNISLHYTHIQE